MARRYKFEDYEAVWQNSAASGNDLLILLALVKFRQPKGMYATRETLAELLKCNVDTVDRSLKRLKELGELEWVKGSDKSKRAKVGSTKATTKLFEAMTESHDAQMELMNVKLASLVSRGVPGVLPPVGAPKVGAAVGFNPALYGPPPVFHQLVDPIAVQAEKARVAAVNFKNILKPPSKKTAP